MNPCTFSHDWIDGRCTRCPARQCTAIRTSSGREGERCHQAVQNGDALCGVHNAWETRRVIRLIAPKRWKLTPAATPPADGSRVLIVYENGPVKGFDVASYSRIRQRWDCAAKVVAWAPLPEVRS